VVEGDGVADVRRHAHEDQRANASSWSRLLISDNAYCGLIRVWGTSTDAFIGIYKLDVDLRLYVR
jgi:hypothetical protein